jgi:hypothetical protein
MAAGDVLWVVNDVFHRSPPKEDLEKGLDGTSAFGKRWQ